MNYAAPSRPNQGSLCYKISNSSCQVPLCQWRQAILRVELGAFDKEHPETMRQVTDSDEKHGSTTPFVNVDEGLLDGRNNLWNKVDNECVLCAVNKKKLRARNKNRSKRTPALASPLLSQKTQLRPELPSKHRHLTF